MPGRRGEPDRDAADDAESVRVESASRGLRWEKAGLRGVGPAAAIECAGGVLVDCVRLTGQHGHDALTHRMLTGSRGSSMAGRGAVRLRRDISGAGEAAEAC